MAVRRVDCLSHGRTPLGDSMMEQLRTKCGLTVSRRIESS